MANIWPVVAGPVGRVIIRAFGNGSGRPLQKPFCPPLFGPFPENGEDQQGQEQEAGDELDDPAGVIGGGVEGKPDGVIARRYRQAAECVVGADDGDFHLIDIGRPATVVEIGRAHV